MSLEAVFRYMNDGDVRVPIEAPEGSHLRYLSSFSIEVSGMAVVRLAMHAHARDGSDLHTVCTRLGRVTIECGMCAAAYAGVDAFDVLANLAQHSDDKHDGAAPAFYLRELWADQRTVERRHW